MLKKRTKIDLILIKADNDLSQLTTNFPTARCSGVLKVKSTYMDTANLPRMLQVITLFLFYLKNSGSV